MEGRGAVGSTVNWYNGTEPYIALLGFTSTVMSRQAPFWTWNFTRKEIKMVQRGKVKRDREERSDLVSSQ